MATKFNTRPKYNSRILPANYNPQNRQQVSRRKPNPNPNPNPNTNTILHPLLRTAENILAQKQPTTYTMEPKLNTLSNGSVRTTKEQYKITPPTSKTIKAPAITGELVGIIDKGINDIVIQLQNFAKVSPTNTDAVKYIINRFTTVQNDVKQNIEELSRTKQEDTESIVLKKDNNGIYNIDTTKDFILNEPKAQTILSKQMTNLDNTNFLIKYDGSKQLLTNNETNIQEIQSRLNNCYELEYKYLDKHKELMTTFAFTLNLYDSFEYSIKIILFLLKNLGPYLKSVDGSHIKTKEEINRETIIDKTCPPCTPLTINLPPRVLDNVKTMVDRVAKLKTATNHMKQAVLFDNDIQQIITTTKHNPTPPTGPISKKIDNNLPVKPNPQIPITIKI